MRADSRCARPVLLLACLAVGLSACSGGSPAASPAGTAGRGDGAQSQPAPGPAAGPNGGSVAPAGPGTRPSGGATAPGLSGREPTGLGVVGARDDSWPASARRATLMCQALLGGRWGDLESAFLTTVGQVRDSSRGNPFGPETRVAGPLWPSAPADAPAAWCSVRSGTTLTIAAVGPHRQVVKVVVAGQAFDPGRGGQGGF